MQTDQLRMSYFVTLYPFPIWLMTEPVKFKTVAAVRIYELLYIKCYPGSKFEFGLHYNGSRDWRALLLSGEFSRFSHTVPQPGCSFKPIQRSFHRQCSDDDVFSSYCNLYIPYWSVPEARFLNPWHERFDWFLIREITSDRILLYKQKSQPWSIFIWTPFLKLFLHSIFPLIRNKLFLMIGGSDTTLGTILNLTQISNLIEDSRVLGVAVHNKDVYDTRIVGMPIGASWTHMTNAHPYVSNNKEVARYKKVLGGCMSVRKTIRGTRDDRRWAYKELKNSTIVDWQTEYDLCHSTDQLMRYAFRLSPFGNGFDCFRTWESFSLGSTVILQAGIYTEPYRRAAMPAMIITSFSEITPDRLDAWERNGAAVWSDFVEARKMDADFWWNYMLVGLSLQPKMSTT